MYPQRELVRLAVHKAALRRDIARRRIQCADAAARVAQPLQWLDRVVAFWRRVSPLALLAALPMTFLAARTVSPRLKIVSSLLRWGPLVLGAVRSIGSTIKSRFASAKS